MQDTIDLLQIKIENAKKQLSKETLAAIASVPWQAEILKMRETKGYSFEQLGDLEIETELVLCGLVSPLDYPKELESRMKLSKAQVNELLNEMNKQVFSKIKEELMKNTGQIPPPPSGKVGRGSLNSPRPNPLLKGEGVTSTFTKILNSAGIKIIAEKETLPVPEKLELSSPLEESPLMVTEDKLSTPSSKLATPQEGNILAQKLSGSVKNEIVKTDHSLNNLTPSSASQNKPAIDPYREIPE